MRITSIESRILGYDIAEAWAPSGPPEGIPSTFYQYSLDTFHTDEGIDGYTMQNFDNVTQSVIRTPAG